MSAVRSESVQSAQRGTGACIPQAIILCLQTLSGHPWDLKEKSYLQACEKAEGGTCCPYTPVKQPGS